MRDIDLEKIAARIARQVILEEVDLEKEKDKQDAIADEISKHDLKAKPGSKDSEEKRLTDEAEDEDDKDEEEAEEKDVDPKPKPEAEDDDDENKEAFLNLEKAFNKYEKDNNSLAKRPKG